MKTHMRLCLIGLSSPFYSSACGGKYELWVSDWKNVTCALREKQLFPRTPHDPPQEGLVHNGNSNEYLSRYLHAMDLLHRWHMRKRADSERSDNHSYGVLMTRPPESPEVKEFARIRYPNEMSIVGVTGAWLVITQVDVADETGTFKFFQTHLDATNWIHEVSKDQNPEWHEKHCQKCGSDKCYAERGIREVSPESIQTRGEKEK